MVRLWTIVSLCAFLRLQCTIAGVDTTAEERAKLRELKASHFTKLQAEWQASKGAAGLYKLADLGIPEAVKLIEMALDSLPPSGEGSPSDVELIEMLGTIGRAECVPIVLRASRKPGADGAFLRMHAAKVLSKLLGPRAIPRLREMQNDKAENVQFAVRRELVKLGDAEAVKQVLSQLERACLAWENPATYGPLLHDAAEAHLTEAIPSIRRLLQCIDWRRDPQKYVRLKLDVAVVVLGLGDREAVPALIELVDAREEQKTDLGSPTPAEFLWHFTRQGFGRDKKKWQDWWDREGKQVPIFTATIPEKERLAILEAVLAWARSEASGPFIDGPIVYLEKRQNNLILFSENVRLYTRTELELLAVIRRSFDLTDVVSNGERAFATISHVGMPMGTSFFKVELKNAGGQWTVFNTKEQQVRE